MKNINRRSKGKKIKKKNGSDVVLVYGMYGCYEVKNQRYILEDGSSTSYLAQCSSLPNGLYSNPLCNFIEEWSSVLSYEKVSDLLNQTTGINTLSSSGVQSYLERKSTLISQEWLSKSQTERSIIEVSNDILIYQEASPEVILMMDDVGVKAQKPQKKVVRQPNDAKRRFAVAIRYYGGIDFRYQS